MVIKKAKRLARRVVYKNPRLNLYLDRVRMPSGIVIEDFHFIHFNAAAVGVLVENARGQFLLERMYRYPTDSVSWEIPAGGIDLGETALHAARREVLEETGYEVSRPRHVYSYHPNNGKSNMLMHLVRCRAAKRVGGIDPHEVQAIRWVSVPELRRMLKARVITDGLTLSALLFV